MARIRTLQEAKVLQDKMKKDASHVIGILNYWIEFIARGESPTHSTFYDDEQKQLLNYVANIISTFTDDTVIISLTSLKDLKDKGHDVKMFVIDDPSNIKKRVKSWALNKLPEPNGISEPSK